jgi:hypothetical protein
MKIHRVTIEQLQAGLKLETGERHRVVILRPRVLLELEWDENVVEELPDDLALGLTVEGAVQRQDIRDGIHDDGRVRVAFRWYDENGSTSLQVSTAGRDVPLWKNKVIGKDAGMNALAVLIEPADEPEAQQEQGEEVLATVEPGPHAEESNWFSNGELST